jgi:hypothetical protein
MANIAKELLSEFRDEVAETARSVTRAEVPA